MMARILPLKLGLLLITQPDLSHAQAKFNIDDPGACAQIAQSLGISPEHPNYLEDFVDEGEGCHSAQEACRKKLNNHFKYLARKTQNPLKS